MTTPSPKGATHGALAAVRGFRLALAHPEIRKLYRLVALVLLAITLALMGGLGALLFHYSGALGDEASWGGAAIWLLRIGGLLVIGMAAPLLALVLVNAFLPMLGERVFLAGLRVLAPARAEALAAAAGTSSGAGLVSSVLRLIYFLTMTVLAFGLTLVPVLGAVLGPLVQIYLTSRALAWELLDPYFDRRALAFGEQRALIRGQRWAVVGFGLPLTLLMAVPLVGPLLFGFAQAAAAVFVVDVLGDGDDAGRAATG